MILALNSTMKMVSTGGAPAEVWKSFTADGDTTDFDCKEALNYAIVIVNGITLSTDDYTKDDTSIKFEEAPDKDSAIRVLISI